MTIFTQLSSDTIRWPQQAATRRQGMSSRPASYGIMCRVNAMNRPSAIGLGLSTGRNPRQNARAVGRMWTGSNSPTYNMKHGSCTVQCMGSMASAGPSGFRWLAAAASQAAGVVAGAGSLNSAVAKIPPIVSAIVAAAIVVLGICYRIHLERENERAEMQRLRQQNAKLLQQQKDRMRNMLNFDAYFEASNPPEPSHLDSPWESGVEASSMATTEVGEEPGREQKEAWHSARPMFNTVQPEDPADTREAAKAEVGQPTSEEARHLPATQDARSHTRIMQYGRRGESGCVNSQLPHVPALSRPMLTRTAAHLRRLDSQSLRRGCSLGQQLLPDGSIQDKPAAGPVVAPEEQGAEEVAGPELAGVEQGGEEDVHRQWRRFVRQSRTDVHNLWDISAMDEPPPPKIFVDLGG